jgi:hypothetical protein
LGLRLLLPSQSAHRIFFDGFALDHKWVHGWFIAWLRRVLGVGLSLSTSLRVEKRHLFVKLLTPFDKVNAFLTVAFKTLEEPAFEIMALG